MALTPLSYPLIMSKKLISMEHEKSQKNQSEDKDKSQASSSSSSPIPRHACMRSEIFMQFVSWPFHIKKEREKREESKKSSTLS